MKIDSFDVITFDCYGTLIDWESGIVKAFREAASLSPDQIPADQIIEVYLQEEHQVEFASYRAYREVLDETAQRVARRLSIDIAPGGEHFLSESLVTWLPFPDTLDALERLSKRVKLGILSNVDDDLLAGTRKHFNIRFDLIVTAQQVNSYKPGLAHFQEAARRLGDARQLHAAQSYFHDVVPATSLGIPAAWINRKAERSTEGGPRPDYEVRNLAELAEMLGV